jgi:hypothetical protein
MGINFIEFKYKITNKINLLIIIHAFNGNNFVNFLTKFNFQIELWNEIDFKDRKSFQCLKKTKYKYLEFYLTSGNVVVPNAISWKRKVCFNIICGLYAMRYNLPFNASIILWKFWKMISVIPLYSEPRYSEYPLIVNDLLCTEHSIVETNGE